MLLAELVSGKKIKQQDAPLRRLSVQPKEDSHELPRYMLQTEGMQWFGYYEFGLKSANSYIQITNRENMVPLVANRENMVPPVANRDVYYFGICELSAEN